MLYYATRMSYPYWKLLLCVDVTFDMDDVDIHVIDVNIGCGTHAACSHSSNCGQSQIGFVILELSEDISHVYDDKKVILISLRQA